MYKYYYLLFTEAVKFTKTMKKTWNNRLSPAEERRFIKIYSTRHPSPKGSCWRETDFGSIK